MERWRDLSDWVCGELECKWLWIRCAELKKSSSSCSRPFIAFHMFLSSVYAGFFFFPPQSTKSFLALHDTIRKYVFLFSLFLYEAEILSFCLSCCLLLLSLLRFFYPLCFDT